MKDTITIYLFISVLALALKYGVKFITRLWNKNHNHSHEDDHKVSDYIKIAILILLALVLWYIATLSYDSMDNYQAFRLMPENKPYNKRSVDDVYHCKSNCYQIYLFHQLQLKLAF